MSGTHQRQMPHCLQGSASEDWFKSDAGEAGALVAGLTGINQTREPFSVVPEPCLDAAFFDALIAQQDRHTGNLRTEAAPRRRGR